MLITFTVPLLAFGPREVNLAFLVKIIDDVDYYGLLQTDKQKRNMYSAYSTNNILPQPVCIYLKMWPNIVKKCHLNATAVCMLP